MTTFLVAGGDRVDAGKTTFAVGLVEHLGTTGFKPRAGNDYWFDHDDYRRAIAAGRLYGKDARKLAEASAADVAPEEINPIHRLWMPAPEVDGFIGAPDRAFVLDRVGEEFVVNAGADVPASAREALPLADAPRIGTVEELNAVTGERYLPRLRALAERVRDTDPAVVESYGDVARPLQGIEPDRVAVVEPMRVRIYDGGRYDDACEVASGSPHDGQLEERVDDVADLIDPDASVPLPPLGGEERADPARVAEAYGEAYAALID